MEEQYYLSIKDKLIKSEIYDKARNYAKDRNKVKVYFEIGELLSTAGKKYGKNIINIYSQKLTIDVGKKYNYRTLYRMRKFYELFSEEKLTTLLSKLSWSYYNEVLALKNNEEIFYYLNECIIKTLTVRQLRELIKNQEYDRLSEESRTKIIKKIK